MMARSDVTSTRAVPKAREVPQRVRPLRGARLFLPSEAARKRQMEERLLSVFRQWGFQEVLTPTLDYYDTLSRGIGRQALDDLFKLVDRDTGQLLALRSDITPQIAYLAATTLRGRPRPLRLCYAGRVYRYVRARGRLQQEFHQAGVELIGLNSLEADVETIAIAVESLRVSGISDFKVALSHMGFLRGVLAAFKDCGVSEDWTEELCSALARKDLSGLEALGNGLRLPRKMKGLVLALPDLVGGLEVLDRAASLMPGTGLKGPKKALLDLRTIYEMLRVYGAEGDVAFDLSELRGFDYYTGPVLEAFSRLAGFPILSGGRYDDLMGQFGVPSHATGFAIDVGGLLEMLEAQGGKGADEAVDAPEVILIDFSKDKRRALALARDLREKGYRVARDIIRRDLADSLQYARETGTSFALLLGHRSVPTGRILLRDLVLDQDVVTKPPLLLAELRRMEKRHARRGHRRRPVGG